MAAGAPRLLSWRAAGAIAAIALLGCSGGGAAGKPDAASADAADAFVSDAIADRSDVSTTADATDAPSALDSSDAVDVPSGTDAPDVPSSDASDTSDASVTPAEPYPHYVSGSRVRVNTIQGADGTVLKTGLHDTQMDADCRFTADASGTIRCLPDGNPQIVFLDAECKNAVAMIAQCTSLTDWALFYKGMGYETYKVGAAVATPAAFWNLQEAGTASEACVASSQDPASWSFAAVELRPATSFVAATVTDETRAGVRLGAQYYAGADGSKERTSYLEAGVVCLMLRTADGAIRCVPSNVRYVVAGALVFADDRCTEPVVRFTTGTTPPRYVRTNRPPVAGQCGGIWSMHEVLAPYQGNVVWSGASCVQSTPSGDGVLYRLGPDVSTMLVALAGELRGGGTRLGALGLRGSDGSIFEPIGTSLFDTRYGELCEFTPVVGGGLRCLPSFNGGAGFADAACQLPAYTYPSQACQWPGAATVHRTSFTYGTNCGRGLADKAVARGAQVTTTYEFDGAMCAPRAQTPGDAYADGADVGLSEFVAGDARRE